MSLRGPQALASLEEAMRDIRREEDEISKRLARAGERISKHKETEAELFRQLARLRLDPAMQGELDGQISSAEASARAMLKGHAADVTAAEAEMKAIETERTALVEKRRNAAELLEKRRQALDDLAAKVIAQLQQTQDYQAQRQAADDLDEIARQSLHKTAQAEADRDEKGRPYRDDPLFMYLWEASYGTSAYRANNLVRYLDGLVAAHIGYAKARPNFAMLNDIPLRLREHAEQQEANAAAADAALTATESAAVDAAGGRPLREAVAEATAALEAVDTAILACEDRRDTAAKRLQELAEGRDPAFATATSTLAEALGREDMRTLLAEARQTRTGQDDTLVGQIDEARARMREEEEESREQRERLKTLAARRRELEDIQWEFKKQRFDDPRSSFGEDRLVGDLLNDFLRGGISAASYWEQWQRSQNWAPGSEWGAGSSRPRRPSASGSGFPWPDSSIGGGPSRPTPPRPPSGGFGGGWSGGSSGGSGGFSRPRSGSSGTRKHGGFKTGGGF